MALLKSLKKVLTELGGTPEPRDLTAKTIDKIADNISGGGGGGSGVFIVESYYSESGGNYYLNKTASEIINAMPLAYGKVVTTDAENPDYIELNYYRIYGYAAFTGGNYGFEFDGRMYAAENLYAYPHTPREE